MRIPASLTSAGTELFKDCPGGVTIFGSSGLARSIADTYGYAYIEE